MYDERLLALIEADRRRLVKAAARLLGQAEAEDAVQDAYVRGLEAKTLELNVAQAWLLTVVRNLAIDRLRRREWLRQWLSEVSATDTMLVHPSAEDTAAEAQGSTSLLRLVAKCLSPADGAAVLLHGVFEASHLEIAEACGRTETACRQQLRRALLRLRRTGEVGARQPDLEAESDEESLFHLYVQSLQHRDPRALWALLRQPPISSLVGQPPVTAGAWLLPHATTTGVVQVGDQLALVHSLDGIVLCVVPLGVRSERELTAELQ